MPRTLCACGIHKHANRLKLVVAWEDHCLRLDLASLLVSLLFNLQVDKASEQVEETIPLYYFLPQVCRAIASPCRIGRIPGTTVPALDFMEAGE